MLLYMFNHLKKRKKKKIKYDKTASITEERKIKIKKKKIMF